MKVWQMLMFLMVFLFVSCAEEASEKDCVPCDANSYCKLIDQEPVCSCKEGYVKLENTCVKQDITWEDIALTENYQLPEGAYFFDIRTSNEKASGYPEGADLDVVFSFNEKNAFIEKISEKVNQDKSAHIILTCASTGRSKHAVAWLIEADFTRVGHLLGGTFQWKALGLPWME